MNSDLTEMHRALYEQTPNAVIAVSVTREILALNPAAEKLFGYSASELVGKRSLIIYANPRDFDRIGQSYFHDQRPDTAAAYRVRYRTRTGRIFDGETIPCIMRDAAGERTGHVCIISDVTAQLALSAKLEASDVQLRAALASAREGALSLNLITGLGSTRGFVNDFLGIPSADATISIDRLLDVVEPDARDRIRKALRRLRETPTESIDIVFRATGADDSQRWLRIHGGVSEFARDGTGLRFSGVISDTTERHELEHKLAERERQLTSAVEAGSAGIWEVNARTLAVTPLGEIRGMLGLAESPREIDGRVWLEHTHPDDRAGVESQLEGLATGAAEQLDATYRLKDARSGDWVWLRSRGRFTEVRDGDRIAAGVLTDITPEMTLRAQLGASEQRLQDALEATGEAAWKMDMRTQQMTVFGAIDGIVGQTGGAVSFSYDDFLAGVVDEERAAWASHPEQFLSGKMNELDQIVRYRGADGGTVLLHNRGRVTERDENGVPTQLTGFIGNVTKAYETKRLLSERENQLRVAVEAAGIGLWRMDFTTRKVWLRGQLTKSLFGKEGEAQFSIDEWFDRIHPDDLPALMESSEPAFKREVANTQAEWRMRDVSGQWRWHKSDGVVVAVGDEDESVVASGVVWDIDEARRLTDELASERRRFETIYRATPAMLSILEPSGRIIDASDYWLSGLGYEREDVVGRLITDFVEAGSESMAPLSIMNTMRAEGSVYNLAARIKCKNGEILETLSSAFLMRDADGRPYRVYGVMTDVTPLARALQQLERSNKELDRFATVASHDLQEPLRKIGAFAQLLKRRQGAHLDEASQRSLDFLVDAADRMQTLVNDLLTYSKMASQPLKLEDRELSDLIDEVSETLALTIEETGATIEVQAEGRLRADRLLLRQTFQNLFSNALKYRSDQPPVIRVTARDADGYCRISVQDNGIGIEPRFADKIFQPFQRLHTRESYPGTGIGLAIVRQAVERHGGKVWLDTDYTDGARFHITLPISRDDAVD